MSGPAVTIVIPTYNRADWLRGAIESVLAQDYDDVEVLVVDDGSTDDTPAVLSEHERRSDRMRFRAVAQANAGQAAAINRGWELARGELLGYLSDDDKLADRAVSRLVEELVTDPGSVVAYPCYHLIEPDGSISDTIRPIEYSPREAVRLHDTIIGPGALIRRDALQAAGGWSTELRWVGDLILWVRLGLRGRVRRVEEPLAFWRRHPEARTSQLGVDHAREHVRVAELGIGLLGGEAVDRADRAEALRNACILGSLLGGDWADPAMARWKAIDLQGPKTSAWGARLGLTEMPDERADEAAELARALAEATAELAALRVPDARPPGGLEAARELLGRAGILQGNGAAPGTAPEVDDFRGAMMEAAWHCSADSGADRNRFMLVDTTDGTVAQRELDELSSLAYGCSRDTLRAWLAQRRSEIERLSAGGDFGPGAGRRRTLRGRLRGPG
jgi:Glycosyl transferase family 2